MEFNEYIVLEQALTGLSITIEGKVFVPNFMYGSHSDMLTYLNQKRKEISKTGGNIYPLIWVETPIKLQGHPFAESDVSILLATLTTSNLSNITRTKEVFQKILDPLVPIVVKAINNEDAMQIVDIDNQETTRHFNYDTNSEHQGSDIWDVIKLERTIRFNLKCI